MGKSTFTASGFCSTLDDLAASFTSVVALRLGATALTACISFWLILTSLKGLISLCTTLYNKPLFFGSFRLNIIVLYLFMYLLSVLRNMSNISISMLATSFVTSLSDISKSSQSETLLDRMLVRVRWMLCLIWVLGWEGLEEGALGAGGTGRFLVSLSSVGAVGGFWPEAEAGTLLDGGLSPGCFFGMTYVVLLTIRAPVS